MVSVSGTEDEAATRRRFWAWGLAGDGLTHHHAAGRDHRRWYMREVPHLFTAALRGAKAVLDPAGIMTPGVLLRSAGAVSYSHEGGR